MWLQRQRLGVFANEKVTIDSESSLSPLLIVGTLWPLYPANWTKTPLYTVAPGLMLSL
jgi:hypothetical protein